MINKDYLLLLFFTLSLTFFSFAETSLNASDHLAEEVISLSFASPANNTQFSIGQPIGVTINAADSDGSISNVRLFINNTLVRQENFAPYEWGTDNANQNDNAIQNLAAGSYTLTAVATDRQALLFQLEILVEVGVI